MIFAKNLIGRCNLIVYRMNESLLGEPALCNCTGKDIALPKPMKARGMTSRIGCKDHYMADLLFSLHRDYRKNKAYYSSSSIIVFEIKTIKDILLVK